MTAYNQSGITALIDALKQNHDGFRQMAMRRLLNIGPAAVPPLIALLADRRPEIQESAAIILTTMGKSVIVDLVRTMKTSKDRKLCWGCAWVLATLGPEARAALPTIKIAGRPELAPPRETTISNYPGVWSDSWITKVRAKLEEARKEVSYFLLAAESPG